MNKRVANDEEIDLDLDDFDEKPHKKSYRPRGHYQEEMEEIIYVKKKIQNDKGSPKDDVW